MHRTLISSFLQQAAASIEQAAPLLNRARVRVNVGENDDYQQPVLLALAELEAAEAALRRIVRGFGQTPAPEPAKPTETSPFFAPDIFEEGGGTD